MAKLAFSCSYSPGQSDEKPFKELLVKVMKREPTLVEESCLRRLYNESYATVAADIRSQTEQTSDETHRKLAPADRAARLEEQQGRLTGITIRGPYEPGDSVVDKFVSFYESDRLQWLSWDQCVSREHELLSSGKRDQRLVVQSSGELKLSATDKVDPCDTSSEILLRYCLMRRGLAMEQANILAYKYHDKWLEKILSCRLETVPAGFARTTFQQIEAADKRLFVLLAEKTRAGIKSTSAGRPCDNCFDECMSSTEVLTLLQPKPIAVRGRDDEPPSKRPKVDRPQFERYNASGGGKGKGKSKGKATPSQFMRIPSELLNLGCVGATSQNNRICFSYNLKRCNGQVQNQRCDKGLHVCAVKGCFKQHPALECPNRKKD
eukprot:s3745_g7.t1